MMSDMQIPIMLGSDKATQHLLAPVQEDLVAIQNYAVGSYFIFNNGMYKVTDNIDLGDPIIIGSGVGCNADMSDTVMEQVRGGKGTDFADAYAKATNSITIEMCESATDNRVLLTVPKASITSSDKDYCNSAYADSSHIYYIYARINTSGLQNLIFLKNGSTVLSPIAEYYYD